MNKIQQFLNWCAGTSYASISPESQRDRSWAGWIVLISTVLFTFFICIELIDYFSNLTEDPAQKLFRSESPALDTLAQDTLTLSLENSSATPTSNQDKEAFQSYVFFKKHASFVGIVVGLLLGTLLFTLIRWISGIQELYGKIQRFLWWSAGARIDYLEDSKSDHAKYFGIGGTVVFTALMATFAGGYAFYIAFDRLFLSMLFGVFWGALIFNLDRYIVSSLGIGDGTTKITRSELASALPRIVLAILIAIVVATPLELKIFEKEINVEIQEIIDEKKEAFARSEDYKLEEIQLVKNQLSELKEEEKRFEQLMVEDPRIDLTNEDIDDLNKQKQKLANDYNQLRNRIAGYERQAAQHRSNLQREGISENERRDQQIRLQRMQSRITSTQRTLNSVNTELGNINKAINAKVDERGSVERERKEDYALILEQNRNRRATLNQQLANLQEARYDAIQRKEEIAQQFTGLMAKLEALSRLSYEDKDPLVSADQEPIPGIDSLSNNEPPSNNFQLFQGWFSSKKKRTAVFYAKWLITILFICIEIAPILLKLMTEAGPYDDRLAEDKLVSQKKYQKVKQREEKEREYHELTLDQNFTRTKEETAAIHQEILEKAAAAQKEIIELALEEWKLEQMRQMRDDPGRFVKE